MAKKQAVKERVLVLPRPRGPIKAKYLAFVSCHEFFDWKMISEIFFRGGFGTAKTTALVEHQGLMRILYPKSPGFIARSELTVFNRTTRVVFLEMWGEYGTHRAQEHRFDWHNGSVTYFLGLDSPNSLETLKSLEVLDGAVDEADEMSEDIWAVAKNRARWQPKGELREQYLKVNPATKLPLARLSDVNDPDSPVDMPFHLAGIANFNGHDWLYYRFKYERETKPEVKARYYLEANTDENLSLPSGYMASLSEESPEFQARFMNGRDDIMYGRILFKLNTSRADITNKPAPGSNLFEPADIPDHWPMYGGVDVGYKHPTAGLIGHVGEDGRIWITDEYLATNMTSLENAVAFKSLAGVKPFAAVYGSPDAARKDQTTGESASDHYAKAGVVIIPAMLNHDDSADKVNQMLRPIVLEPGDVGKPRLMISTACRKLIKQLEGYTWQMRRKKAHAGSQALDPDGGDWDLYDCLRMLACSIPPLSRANQLNLTPGRKWVLPRDARVRQELN